MASNKKRDDPSGGFNVAFLDVMACGLGAVLLILILVKFNEIAPVPTQDTQILKDELNATLEQNRQIQAMIAKAAAADTSSEQNTQRADDQIGKLTGKLKDIQSQIQQEQEALAQKKALAQKIMDRNNAPAPPAPPAPPVDRVQIKGSGEQDYLIGLKVTGSRIGILVDVSGSMVSEILPEALILTQKPASVRQATAKWQRTLNTVRWLMNRAPSYAKVSVVAFNGGAVSVGPRVVSASDSAAVRTISSALNGVEPEGGSNLAVGLSKIQEVMPDMTNLYLVTDGLPNLSDSVATTCALSRNVSGACRVEIFTSAVSQFRSRAQVDVILLPFDGDVDAPFFLWDFASRYGGMLLAPSKDWP